MHPVTVFWFRRDLRLEDNAGLYHALKSKGKVLPLFIFDSDILTDLPDKEDKRVAFIHQQISTIKTELNLLGSDLVVKYGKPLAVWQNLLQQYNIKQVFTNADYEPYAITRDEEVKQLLALHQITFTACKDQCIFDYTEILKDDGKPYTVFTPYSKKWKARLQNQFYLKPYPSEKYLNNLHLVKNPEPMPSLNQIGFKQTNGSYPTTVVPVKRIKNYHLTRNFPALEGTSKLSIHFRFGTISIRQKAKAALALNETFLNELIWRDFYMMILAWFPQVATRAFKPAYENIPWQNNQTEFNAWCNGQTGYPIVDAGMRELNQTGFMHNRVRMIVASFLTKHLLIDWRWGEAYFANKLLDYDLSANNGGWQWAAGCGTDAAPYFRIFNPAIQTKNFDPEFTYIKKWVPEFGTPQYAKPIVNHEFARNRCLTAYKTALQNQ